MKLFIISLFVFFSCILCVVFCASFVVNVFSLRTLRFSTFLNTKRVILLCYLSGLNFIWHLKKRNSVQRSQLIICNILKKLQFSNKLLKTQLFEFYFFSVNKPQKPPLCIHRVLYTKDTKGVQNVHLHYLSISLHLDKLIP